MSKFTEALQPDKPTVHLFADKSKLGGLRITKATIERPDKAPAVKDN